MTISNRSKRDEIAPASPVEPPRSATEADVASATHDSESRLVTRAQPIQSYIAQITKAPTHGFELWSALLLSAVAGYVDTAGCLALFGLFTAHVTGGLVSVGLALASKRGAGMAPRLAMVVVFVASVAATSLFSRSAGRRGRPLTALLCLMTAALTVFLVVGISLERYVSNPDSWAVMVIGASAVAAMGVQNTLMRNMLNGVSPTTIMTGNLTQVTMDLVELLVPERTGTDSVRFRRKMDARRRLVKFGVPLAGFLFGVCLGALLTRAIGLKGIAFPTAVLSALTAISWQRDRHLSRAPAPEPSAAAPGAPPAEPLTSEHRLRSARRF